MTGEQRPDAYGCFQICFTPERVTSIRVIAYWLYSDVMTTELFKTVGVATLLAGEFCVLLGRMVGGFNQSQVASASPDDQSAIRRGDAGSRVTEAATAAPDGQAGLEV